MAKVGRTVYSSHLEIKPQERKNKMKRLMIVGGALSMAVMSLVAEEKMHVADEGNTPRARAIRALDAKDWNRFAYWAEMVDYAKWDLRIKSGLGHCYREGLGGKPRDGKRAFDILSEAVRLEDTAITPAESNDVSRAQLELGICYHAGKGVASNHVEAVKWYRKAAERGYAAAQFCLGACCHHGVGVKKDVDEALSWYRKAAEQGDAQAQCSLGGCYRKGIGVAKDEVEAVKWFRKAAEQGQANAQNNLAWCYCEGVGVGKDDVEAVKWYRKAAEQGDAQAQCNLGHHYRVGHGVPQNMAKALEWYRKAAAQGNADAIKAIKEQGHTLTQREKNLSIREKHLTAMSLASGIDGEAHDKKEEYELFLDIASHENDKDLGEEERECVGGALLVLGTYCLEGVPGLIKKDLAKAFDYFSRASKFDNPVAQYYLGMCYERGDGVARDYRKSIEWYGKALEAGFEKAKSGIERIKRTPGVTTEYVVRSGDMFALIARKHGTTVRVLRALNGLKPDDHIRVGQKLVVPMPGNNK